MENQLTCNDSRIEYRIKSISSKLLTVSQCIHLFGHVKRKTLSLFYTVIEDVSSDLLMFFFCTDYFTRSNNNNNNNNNKFFNEAVRVAVSLRLGLNICAPHTCTCHCGSPVDAWGIHALVCKHASGRFARHHALNDTISRALVSAGIPALKEPAGLSLSLIHI